MFALRDRYVCYAITLPFDGRGTTRSYRRDLIDRDEIRRYIAKLCFPLLAEI